MNLNNGQSSSTNQQQHNFVVQGGNKQSYGQMLKQQNFPMNGNMGGSAGMRISPEQKYTNQQLNL